MKISGKSMQKVTKEQKDKTVKEIADDLIKERKNLYNKLSKT